MATIMKVILLLVNPVIFTCLSSTSSAKGIALWNDPDCYISKKISNVSPQQLVEEFLKEDSEGLLINSSKIEKFALCPGFQGGPDAYEVVKRYSIKKEKIEKDKAEFLVTFDTLGTVSSGGSSGELNTFLKNIEQKNVLLKLIKTPYGWRINFESTHTPRLTTSSARKYLPHRAWLPGKQRLFEETIK
ncbi:hypothetical protein [Bdellovibrio bacteriovorus]|uniref:hypothetical protein n=1 Tax=Bdellovibrio bacteriovorus TaxID=959 RepID=UPI0035A588C4